MAQLLCINANLAKEKVKRGNRQTETEDHAIQPVGDIIGVFDDNHQFSATENDIFDVIPVKGFTREELGSLMINDSESDLKFQFTIKNLTSQDLSDLDSDLTSNLQKTIIINGLRK